VLAGYLPMEYGPHGWRLADHTGRDQEQAAETLRRDLEALAVAGVGYAGPLVMAVLGPVTFGARTYLKGSDVLLADPGAVTDVAAALATAVEEQLAQTGSEIPGADPFPLIQEPALGAALAGRLPTFTGRGTLRTISRPEATELLSPLVGTAVVATGVAAIPAARDAGARTVALDVSNLTDRAWETVAEWVESGGSVWAEVLGRPDENAPAPTPNEIAALLDGWTNVGLSVSGLASLTLAAGASLGRLSPAEASERVAVIGNAAEILAERAA
jgi:hypothetical protein